MPSSPRARRASTSRAADAAANNRTPLDNAKAVGRTVTNLRDQAHRAYRALYAQEKARADALAMAALQADQADLREAALHADPPPLPFQSPEPVRSYEFYRLSASTQKAVLDNGGCGIVGFVVEDGLLRRLGESR